MAKKNKKKDDADRSITLPESTMVYGHLFVKQQYNEASKAQYSCEIVAEEDDLIECGFYAMVEEICKEEGWDVDEINHPAKDGDKKMRKREKKGKDGSIYEDMMVVKATTDFNKDGDNEAGGIQVFDEEVEEVDFTNKAIMYNGCKVRMGVKLKAYVMDEDENYGVTCYLTAIQRVGDGERLGGSSDHSTLFEKVGRKEGKKKKKRKG